MSQGPINLGGAGDIDIYPEETRALMRRLQQSGVAFGDKWSTLAQSIGAGEQEANTGFDTLSVRFRAQYNPAKPDLEKLSTNVRPNLIRLGAGGNKIIEKYVAAAARDVTRMRSLE